MLIRRAECEGGRICDVRLSDGRIAAIGDLVAEPGEEVLEASRGLLIPGLHDHHIHVAALAASLESVRCGPPEVTNAEELAAALSRPGQGWLRGIGYHESVAGMLDAAALDAMIADRPVRIQHRSGRMWFLNSAGLDAVLAGRSPAAGLEYVEGRPTGRLFDADAWLRSALGSEPPSFAAVGSMLLRFGVTGLTEISPANDAAMARHFAGERESGALPQHVLLAGKLDLAEADMAGGVTLGPAKLHLHEAQLPPFEEAARFIREAHERERAVAVHCVTETELVFTLAAIAEAGPRCGDRIEHAAIADDFAVEEIARLGLAVVSQPHFIAERGDAYRRDVEPTQQPFLYRLRAFPQAGVVLAAGSDAPFGGADPWASMAAAVSRHTASGAPLGEVEALSPEEALALYLCAPEDLARRRRVAVGEPADLCLLDRPWAEARKALSADCVRATFIGGRKLFDRVDQAPV
jgi:predicted amidohydrolase YtcJ